LTPDPFPYDDYKDYLNTAKIQQAIGAFVNFTEASQEVYDSFTVTGDDARDVMTTEDILNLLKNNVTVTLWAGDADFICNWFGVEAVANFINPPGFTEAGYAKIETSDDVTVSDPSTCSHLNANPLNTI
jgi:carboxypeptidase C (cathepsin A)